MQGMAGLHHAGQQLLTREGLGPERLQFVVSFTIVAIAIP